ncbi:hypothetical protein CKY39_31410 [Variovorax boronicumulans]|uniref:Uncharacterized protein n=1 Tax=Variovorax boronicumulans TaxID=436515 RepID=A0A250DTH4_9BURK|nr:hypothetical protein [Variovorax boronicumulans]ATA57233.1 hypothetical protein CKY39_31410 [Variovorax boronicumulans]
MSRAKLRNRRELCRSHPVATAVAKAQMASHMTADAEPARDLLAHLGWVIGIGAEIAAVVAPGLAQAKRLHAALRTVVQLSIDNAWQAAQAGVLSDAATEAKDLLVAHAGIGFDLIPSGDYIAARIRDGVASLSDVAGAEIYSTDPKGVTA